ncbi:gliding motility-associated C-terminal domain-containing protein [Chryseobacterium aquaticum]|uniref:Gliding motility-associated C-terminal domain-containing protein n=1 Tax=Chryseobacterium aquaticum TaxID=452084 RepID=A0A848N2M0_9FLAO|nr:MULTISPECIES: gliding motility-associated C-terminal domain-containing protein [Chryseobacterium]NMR33774.1 gliding motility-associated C-terminal domain-containing protein [Chryseobacterium aquaticum]NRQ45850.1 gliding motility-associated C-terminal domain-containing protein [Chryseobacterium sp. C-204]
MKKLLLFFVLITSQLYFSQSDCVTAIPVCGNSSFSYTPTGSGLVDEDLQGCLSSDENYSVWYSFTIATSGTLTFTIDPAVFADDYDFGVYGPNLTCGTLGAPIRCNFSGADGPTGLSLTATDPNGGGTQWSSYMDVVAGQTYYLVIDNFLSTSNGFSLNWGGTATLTSAFNNPALTPNPFITPGTPSATPNAPNEILKCALPMQFDFTTLSAGIINGNPNFTVTYHDTENNAITGASPFTTALVNGTTIYYYRLKYTDPADPTNPINGCFQIGTFKFKQGNIVATDATITACNTNGFGTGTFNLTTANVFTDPTAIKKYYPTLNDLNAGTNEITNPTAYVSAAPKTVFVKVTSVEGCTDTAEITLQFLPPLPVLNLNVFTCNNNNTGSGTFDLTSANVYTGTNITKKYYLTFADLAAGTNEITNPVAFISGVPKKIFVKVINSEGCTGNGELTLQFYPTVIVNDAVVESCYIPTNITTAVFDLTTVNVTSQTGVTKKYYTTLANATAGTNEILNPTVYIASNSEVFIKVFNSDSCFSIAKITLKVLPPVKSTVLKDKTICMEDRTTLDAGPGFDGYEWNTGATTQTIQGVPVGSYWVKLQTGKCFTMQQVNVYASQQPIIAGLDITNNTITVNASGGTAPYQYSIDGITWQNSNVFNNLPRGENKIYLKDSFDCNPIIVQVTVPNLINAITPNGDNVNDVLDYTSLAYKKDLVFTIYNRYGNKIYEGDKMRNYKWDGTSSGKKIGTGTYWYTISWTENDANRTQTKYSGWILVKNRE